MDWLADNLTCVLFTKPQHGAVDALQPWLKAFSSSPMNFQNQPGLSRAEGVVGDLRVQLIAQPGRLELALMAVEPEVAVLGNALPPPTVPQAIPKWEDALVVIEQYARKIIEDGVVRIGLVVNLLQRAESALNATALFNQHTRCELPRDATEVAIQFNRTKMLSGRKINRLARWATGAQQVLQLQVGGAVPSPNSRIAAVFHVVTWQLDINTVMTQSSPELDTAQSGNVLAALVQEARTIISAGYDGFLSS